MGNQSASPMAIKYLKHKLTNHIYIWTKHLAEQPEMEPYEKPVPVAEEKPVVKTEDKPKRESYKEKLARKAAELSEQTDESIERKT